MRKKRLIFLMNELTAYISFTPQAGGEGGEGVRLCVKLMEAGLMFDRLQLHQFQD